MTLQSWLKSGWLIEHKTSKEEITELLAIVNRDLSDCKIQNLSSDWKFNIAYNAALQAATIVLAACGYRAVREAHHYRIIQSLSLTMKLPSSLVQQLDRFRKKRNVGGYERTGSISDQEVDEMIALSEHLAGVVKSWLETNHAKLLKNES